ncbi:MAG TPA: biotin/lipoyl-binding protein [Ohtaekwangia sp.]|uniref:biotin/lipoyl-binding protein n=1 Tax=Ohtaekwangia sp. TaxID=2066019 RepID=UPI002F92AE63
MKINWFYILTAAMFTALLFITAIYFKGSGHASVGIAYSRGYKISIERAAQVKSIAVVPGQEVKAGDILVTLVSDELEMEIKKLSGRISILRSEYQEKETLASADIAYIRAQRDIAVGEVDADITETQSELSLNQQLANEYTGALDSAHTRPVAEKIQALKLQRNNHRKAAEQQLQNVQLNQMATQRSLENQVHVLEQELALLLAEQKNLTRYAAADGVVETVFMKEGEQVNAYTPLLSVNPAHPSTVISYLTGRKNGQHIGTPVTVSSYDHPDLFSAGHIIGYGSVVELPEILQKSTAVKAFGREVFIEIDAVNDFAAGEKVLIR